MAGPGGTLRLEPRVMDVLGVLARHAGRVVSHDQLVEAVWPGVVVPQHALSRCIDQLRHDLDNVADAPGQPLIETLPKRGCRLLADVEIVAPAAPPASPRPALAVVPYVVGQWVRGERFYGRAAQIAEILDGPRNGIWLLGTRRVGKTSLLKQLEYLADRAGDPRWFPLYWDFQGAATPGELHVNFTDALFDAQERLQQIGIAVEEVEAEDLFVSLERLRRRLRARERGLLLLCDEVEELITLRREDPSLLRKLRHALQSREDIRTVLASTIRLWTLADQNDDTSPFLHGFAPPLYIERLADDEALALIRQTHLARERRPVIADGDVDSIRACCDNHPYLMQLVCKRYFETGDLTEAIERVATDRMVSYFFSVDFDMLSPAEQSVIRRIVDRGACTSSELEGALPLDGDTLADILRKLQDLGFLQADEAGQARIANDFFRRWIQRGCNAAAEPDPAAASPAVPATAPPPGPPPESGFFAELKRRKVFRVGVAYVAVAWLLLQLGEILFDILDVPGWAGKLLVVLLALGLPLALLLAWAFELTPSGIKRDRDVDRPA